MLENKQLSTVVALVVGATTLGFFLGYLARGRKQSYKVANSILDLIGDTPLLRIASLSDATGCEILAKVEFLNPGGSVKDRIAAEIVGRAMREGRLRRGGLVTEGTAGSTGISLAMVCTALGLRCFIAMPDDAAVEKAELLRALGAEVQRVRPVSISHPDHHVNVARRAAQAEAETSAPGGALFADQFENHVNYEAHLRTGAEILRQTGGRLDAFVSGAGTGGTIAGVSAALKAHDSRIQVFLADPQGSSLYNKVKRGVTYSRVEAEGKRLRHPCDTITEGVGLNRLTANFLRAHVDDAIQVTDQEAVDMAQHLLRADGLFVGSSSAVNCVAAVRAAKALGKPGAVVVTVLCDGGTRHLSRFHNTEYLRAQGFIRHERSLYQVPEK